MGTLDDLYSRYDGTIPRNLHDIAKAGDIQVYTHQIAHAAERQFEKISRETQAQICYYRTAQEPIFSPTTLLHLSANLLYHRNHAIEARMLREKNHA